MINLILKYLPLWLFREIIQVASNKFDKEDFFDTFLEGFHVKRITRKPWDG